MIWNILRRRPGVSGTAFTAGLMVMVLAGPVCGQGPAAPPPAPAGDRPAAEKDLFALPTDSDAQSIETYIQGLVQGFQTRGAEHRSEEGTIAYLNRIEGAMAALQERPLEESPALLVASVRRQVLDELLQLGDEQALPRMKQLLAVVQKSELPALRRFAAGYSTVVDIRHAPTMTPEERTKLIEKIAARLSEPVLSRDAVGYAQAIAEELEYAELHQEAARAYELFAKTVEARQEERLAELVEMMRSSGRRVGLMGNPIDIRGTTLEGQPFNIADWKGKVVLVDFWATWCGPCIGELPNVKQNYDLYHAKGFEIVGISLDENPEQLAAFLKEQQIAWPTLFPANPEERGWNNPLARYYGITGIPAVFLVNQEGKVVSLNARGEELGELLAKLLGPAPGAVPPAAPESGR